MRVMAHDGRVMGKGVRVMLWVIWHSMGTLALAAFFGAPALAAFAACDEE